MITVLISVISIVFGIEAIWPVFLAGILVDLVNIEPLGSHSLLYLLILWLTVRYQRKIQIGAFIYPALFIFLVETSEGLIFRRNIDYTAIISATAAGIVMIKVLLRIFPEKVRAHSKITLTF